MAISSLGGAFHVQLTLLSILNDLDVIRLFSFGWDFPTGGDILGVLGKITPKTSIEREKLAGTALPYAKLLLLSQCAWNFLYPFGLCWCARKNGRKAGRQAGRKAGRKKSHEKCIFHVCGRITTRLGTCVRLTDIMKRAKFHSYRLRGFGALRCWSFQVAIGNQGHP